MGQTEVIIHTVKKTLFEDNSRFALFRIQLSLFQRNFVNQQLYGEDIWSWDLELALRRLRAKIYSVVYNQRSHGRNTLLHQQEKIVWIIFSVSI